MKNLFKLGVCTLAMLFSVSAFAQTAADKIIGVYKVEEEGNQSKVRFTKCDDGTYQGQIIWLSQPNHPDGTRKMDVNVDIDIARLFTMQLDKMSYSIFRNAVANNGAGSYISLDLVYNLGRKVL